MPVNFYSMGVSSCLMVTDKDLYSLIRGERLKESEVETDLCSLK